MVDTHTGTRAFEDEASGAVVKPASRVATQVGTGVMGCTNLNRPGKDNVVRCTEEQMSVYSCEYSGSGYRK